MSFVFLHILLHPQRLEPLPALPRMPDQEEDDDDAVDLWQVDDVSNVESTGRPLYAKWESEDWAMMNIRWELHLLLHAFIHDLGDAKRSAMYVPHLTRYYSKYYARPISPGDYGCSNMTELLAMIGDTVIYNATTEMASCEHDVDTTHSTFVKLTEDERRERQCRIEAGDESAKLSFSKATASAIRPNPSQKKDDKRTSVAGKPDKRSSTGNPKKEETKGSKRASNAPPLSSGGDRKRRRARGRGGGGGTQDKSRTEKPSSLHLP